VTTAVDREPKARLRYVEGIVTATIVFPPGGVAVVVDVLVSYFAVIDTALDIVTVQSAALGDEQPVHPVRREFLSGVAVKVTTDPARNELLQTVFPPQLIPVGFEVVVPWPVPVVLNESK
jgi:hypothetical protein